ncbi:MAG: DNA polymerase Y family protein, partial [Thalassolituus sp.]
MSSWMYLWFPDMYLHSLMTDSADTRSPCVLLSERQHVLLLTDSARTAGVQPGMSLASALLLCPELVIHTLDSTYHQQLLTQRALWACRYSAQVYPDSPQGLWLEIGSMLKLFGGLRNYWRQIEQECLRQHWPVQIATATTPLAARWLALSDTGRPTLQAKELRPLIDALKLEDLQLPHNQLLNLQRLGICTLAELRRLPLAETGRRISPDLMHQMQQLDGLRQYPMTPFQPPLTFSDSALFSHDVEHRNGLFFPLSRLLNSLSGFLHHHQLSVRWIDLSIQHRDQPQTHWQIHFARPEYRNNELSQLCGYQLELEHLTAPATAV